MHQQLREIQYLQCQALYEELVQFWEVVEVEAPPP